MKKAFFLLFACLAFRTQVFASVHIAASCNQIDVDVAVNATKADPAADIPIVVLPNGNCPATVVTVPRSLIIQGESPSMLTIGAANLADTGSRLTGMSLATPMSGNSSFVLAEGQNWRVDHIKCAASQLANCVFAYGARVGRHPTGLVDHVEFVNSRVLVYGNGLNDWSEPSTVGIANASGVVTVEDSNFDMTGLCNQGHCGNVIDSELTARYIFRHNVVLNSGVEAHSNQGTRNARSWEVSDNVFTSTLGWFAPMFLRGGTGVAFNNVVKGYSFTITMDNVDTTCTYPCKDQIGRGRDLPDGTQQLEPAYFWNNTFDGAPTAPRVSAGPILPDRDYFNVPRPGYVQSPYPHPLQAGSAPPIPIPPLPIPTPNQPPNVIMTAPGPSQTQITTKTFTIEATLADDVDCLCVARAEIWIKGVMMRQSFGAKSISVNWNTQPYKGKGDIAIDVIAYDAEGLSKKVTRVVRVPK